MSRWGSVAPYARWELVASHARVNRSYAYLVGKPGLFMQGLMALMHISCSKRINGTLLRHVASEFMAPSCDRVNGTLKISGHVGEVSSMVCI
jgi:hypothetical protein